MHKGFAFSFDLLFMALAVFMMMLIASWFFFSEARSEAEKLKGIGLERAALFVADSIIKNSSENPLLGSAVFDEKLHRVKSNEISLEKLSTASGLELGDYFVKSVSVKGQWEKELKAGEGSECVSVERLVLAQGQKNILEVAVCAR